MVNELFLKISFYQEQCEQLVKISFIKKLPNGQYRVMSEKGRNMGTYDSEEKASLRLKQVEYFKHKGHKADDNFTKDKKEIDLTDIDDFAYSAIVRKLRQKADKNQVMQFLQLFKKEFDKAIKKKLNKPEKVALQNSVIKFNKLCPIKLPKKMIKNAAVSELGDSASVGKYLSDIVKFTISRISPENRGKSLENLKNKIYSLNENEIGNKNMPNGASIGQALVFVKHVLFGHGASYVREVLNNIVRNL